MSTAAAPSASADPFQALDDSKITRFQIKTMFVSGMGFFTDAYDLFVIGIVVSILKPQWSLTTTQVSWLNSATLLASAFGAIIFGRIADMLGRKRIYGYEVLILAAGAHRVGVLAGICVLDRLPDHPRDRHRRRLPGVGHDHERVLGQAVRVAAWWGWCSPCRGSALFSARWWPRSSLPRDVGRLRLAHTAGFGAIPGLAVFYLRRQIHETPRFAMAGGAHEEAQAAIASDRRAQLWRCPTGESKARIAQGAMDGFNKILARNRRMLIWLIGTAGGWLLLDFCYYGNTISSPEILKLINPSGTPSRQHIDCNWRSSWCSRCPGTPWPSC